MRHFHQNNYDFLSDTGSGFGGFSDNPSYLDPAYSSWFAAYGPWNQFDTGLSTGGAGTSGSTASTSGSSTTTATSTAVGTSGSGFVINVIWDSSVASAPSGFITGVMDAVHYLESQFSDPVTINIDVGWGEFGGCPLGSGDLGESGWLLDSYGYSQIVHALRADATTAADTSAIASLPASIPAGDILVTPAEAKALGLAPANGSGIDGYVGFSSTYKYTYDDTNGVAAGTFDLRGVVLHEITEVMGRDLFTGLLDPTLYQLFHYSSPGVIDYSSTTPGYFSIDGGKTDLAAFNTNWAGDAGDWAWSVRHDAADAFVSGGVVNNFSSADVTAMDVIGWNANPYQPSAPTGITYSAGTGTLSALSAAMSATGLSSDFDLAGICEAGGATGDTYSYTLGGPSALSFALTNASGPEKLVAAGTGLTGAVDGKLYSLTVSATDTSGAGSSASPADPLDIIVGSGGTGTIQVSLLANSSTPTFIYDLNGGDTINGSGMTGKLWFASGPGADVMTGGAGANQYMFSAVDDSTAPSMDLITNFQAGSDLIDLSGISRALKYQGDVTGTTINARSVGWQQSGGNTFIYVNTGSASASLGAASMQIELQGTIALASKNFVL